MSVIHTRRTRVLILGFVAALLLSSTASLAQQDMPGSPALYNCEPGMVTGGVYQLVSMTWEACGTVSGGGYILSAPAAPVGFESGCCCAFLPITIRP